MTEQQTDFDQPAVAKPRRRTWWVVAAAAGAAVVLAAGGWFLFLRPSGTPVTGTLVLSGDSFAPSDGGCRGRGPFHDVGAGTTVVISDAAGTTVAAGGFDRGRIEFDNRGVPYRCVLTFTADVPTGPEFYGITIGSRPTLTVPAAELADRRIDLTLG